MIGYDQTVVLIRLLRTFVRPYTREATIVVVLVLVQSIGNLYLPNLNADIINNGLAKGDIPYIWRTGAVMLAITLGLGVIAVVGVYWASRASMGVGRDLRAAVFGRVQSFSEREMHRFGTPSLITRNTNDVQQITLFLQIGLTMMVSAQIMGVRVIRAFIRGDYEQRRFEEANYDLTSTALRVNRLFVITFPAVLAVMNLSTVAVLWFGGRLVDSGQMPIGNMTAFLMYIMQILMSLMMAIALVILVPRAEASAARLQEVVTATPSIWEPSRPVHAPEPTGTVEFRDVSFAYPGGEKPVLQEVNFELIPGQTTAIIGGT